MNSFEETFGAYAQDERGFGQACRSRLVPFFALIRLKVRFGTLIASYRFRSN